MEPPRLIFEQPSPRGRSHLALAGKIAAGTLAVSILAAGGVEVSGGLSGHDSPDGQLGLSGAFAAVSAPAHAKLASVPNWLAVHPAAKHHVVVKRAHAARLHTKASQSSSSAAAHATASSPSVHHAVLVAATSAPSTSTTHSAASTSHPATSWSSHYSWHSTTAADGTTTKVTTTSHSSTVGGQTTAATHTHTTVTPAPGQAAATK